MSWTFVSMFSSSFVVSGLTLNSNPLELIGVSGVRQEDHIKGRPCAPADLCKPWTRNLETGAYVKSGN